MTYVPTSSGRGAEETIVALLRVVAGIVFVVHGAQKLMDISGTIQGFAGMGIPMPQYAVYLAIAGELLGGLGLLVGLLTRVAAFGPFCSMLVAIVAVHLKNGLMAKNGGFEYPLVLACVTLFFVAHGAPAFSLDSLFSRSGRSRYRYREHRVESHA
jgi:putative oxidoreductase